MAKKYIILYPEDYDYEVWGKYCEICGEDPSALSLTISFNDKDVKAEYDEDDEDDEVHYRCTECDLCFTEDEITGMDDDGNDLCPACGKSLTEDDIDKLR